MPLTEPNAAGEGPVCDDASGRKRYSYSYTYGNVHVVEVVVVSGEKYRST